MKRNWNVKVAIKSQMEVRARDSSKDSTVSVGNGEVLTDILTNSRSQSARKFLHSPLCGVKHGPEWSRMLCTVAGPET